MFPFQGLNMRRIFTQIMEVTFARSLNHESSQHRATEVDQQSIAPRIELTSERTSHRTGARPQPLPQVADWVQNLPTPLRSPATFARKLTCAPIDPMLRASITG